MSAPPLKALDFDLLQQPLLQSDIATDTCQHHTAAHVMSARVTQLKLADGVCFYVSEVKAGHQVSDSQAVLPIIADLLEHSSVSLNPFVHKKLDVTLQGRADLRKRTLEDYPLH